MNKHYRLAAIALACCCAATTTLGAQDGDPNYKNMYQQLLIEKEAMEAKLQMVISQLQDEISALRNQLDTAKSDFSTLQDRVRKEELEHQERMRGQPENFQIEHAEAQDIAEVLWATFGNDIKVAVMPSTNSLVVRGADEQRKQIRELLAKIDVPSAAQKMPQRRESRTLAVTIDLLQATTGSSEAGQLPAHLKSVGEALRASGAGNFRSFGHLMARTHENGKFSANGLVDSGIDEAPTAQVRISGFVSPSESGKSANLEINAVLEAPLQIATTRSKRDNAGNPVTSAYRYEDFGIETDASVPLGDYVVLGAIPAKLASSDTILMVIRVTEQ